mmetsp:Transcript_117566/g.279139  ORF Transcript_117566/g.279139 Transcript_117566/m.279139 type:complete len:83 (-) Transcript_117566:154-402(-)
MDSLAEANDGVTFLLVNLRGMGDAQSYKTSKGLKSAKLIHAAARPPDSYGLKYIPHKTIIGKDGKVVKNFDGVNLASDIKDL